MEARAAISARACGSMSSTLWSPKTFERADLKPGVGAAMGLGGSGAFASCMWHKFVHPRASRAWGKVVSGWIMRFPMSTSLLGQLWVCLKVPNIGSLLSKDTPRGEPGGKRRGESLWGLTGGVAECVLE